MDEKNVVIEESNEGFTLLELFNAIKNNIIILLLIFIGVVALGVFYTEYLVTPMYTSSIDLQIYIEHEVTSGTDNAKAYTANQVANNIKEIVKYNEIIEAVIESENIPYRDLDSKVKSIANRISSSQVGQSSAVRISYKDPNPVKASEIVIALAKEVERRVNLPYGSEDIEKTGSLRFATEKITPINYPKINPNQAPSSPNKSLNIIISILLGGIIGVVVVILKEQFSTKFTSKKEIESLLQLPVLAVIPNREGFDIHE